MFYIKKITITSGQGTVSSVDLKPGLNIVHGESNTGKSLVLNCIDYMFGAEKHRFDAALKIKEIMLVLDVDGKNITMRREIDSNDIEVSSTVDYIESDTYKIGRAKKWINNVWLRLLGIEEPTKIIMTLAGRSQSLTLRTFVHLILCDETRIQGEGSMLSQGKGIVRNVAVPVYTSLLYLATGNNYLPDDASGDPKIKKAKKEAIKSFVDKSMLALEERKVNELANFSKLSPYELQNRVDSIIEEIGAVEGALERATSQSKLLGEELIELDDQITESRMLMNRNKSLESQYASDIKRLTFIVEGNIQHDNLPTLTVCPFCNGQLTKDQGDSCIDAAIVEVEKIEMQIRDLRSVQISLEQEIKEFTAERTTVLAKRKEIDSMIRGELQPQIVQLRSSLADYTLSLNQYKAKEMIEAFSDVLVSGLEEAEKEAGEDMNFNAKGKFSEVFLKSLNSELKSLLEICNYKNFTGAYFDIEKDEDVVVNGHVKRSQGQGYRAFLNSVFMLALYNCLDSFKKCPIPLLVIDSPILSLKEKQATNKSGFATAGMKDGLFRYLVSHQSQRQTIIIENDIPNIEYGETNQIEFTHDDAEGSRYGFVVDYRE